MKKIILTLAVITALSVPTSGIVANAATTPDTTTSYTYESSVYEGTITGDDVCVRSGPGTNYSVIAYANEGDIYHIYGRSGKWYKVKYRGQTAYISTKYLSVD